jgi:hypothetical protein
VEFGEIALCKVVTKSDFIDAILTLAQELLLAPNSLNLRHAVSIFDGPDIDIKSKIFMSFISGIKRFKFSSSSFTAT